MDWRILVFYPEPEARDKFTYIRQPMLKLKHILASMIFFDSDMSKSTNTVVYFDWKTVIYNLRLRKMSHTIYAANGKVSHIHRRMC